jgi:hypothetical protein
MSLPQDFNWQKYLSLNPDISIQTQEFAEFHYLEYGVREKRYYKEEKRLPDDFIWQIYFIVNPDVTIQTQEFAEYHYLEYGIQEKRQYKIHETMNVKNKTDIPKDKKNILYYVGTTSYQNFNTGIQRVSRNLSNIIGNYFNEFNLFLVIFDDTNNDFRLINSDELNTFTQFNGYNHLEYMNWDEKNELFNQVKNKPKNILFIPELLHTNQYAPCHHHNLNLLSLLTKAC